MTRSIQARSVKTVEIILTAAESLIARQGLNSLTMDAVAAEAGISKGGVLHHFRSKDALIAGLVSRKLTMVREGAVAEERQLVGQPQRVLRAMIRQSALQYGDEAGFPPALLVAAIQTSGCLGEIRSMLDDKLERIRADSGGAGADAAAALFFAAFGLLLARTLGFSTMESDEARSLFEAIERMACRSDA